MLLKKSKYNGHLFKTWVNMKPLQVLCLIGGCHVGGVISHDFFRHLICNTTHFGVLFSLDLPDFIHSSIVSFMVQLRRERIAERIRALQELVPSVNKVNTCSLCDCITQLLNGAFLYLLSLAQAILHFVFVSYVCTLQSVMKTI